MRAENVAVGTLGGVADEKETVLRSVVVLDNEAIFGVGVFSARAIVSVSVEADVVVVILALVVITRLILLPETEGLTGTYINRERLWP